MANNNTPNIFQRDYSIPQPFIDKATRRDWVRFGYDNLYPQQCIDLANESPLQKAILENKLSYMYGAGPQEIVDTITQPNVKDTWGELLYKCMVDYTYLEAFAVQVIISKSGDRYIFYHQPVDQVRLGQYNQHNFIEKAYLCSNWAKANRDLIAEIKMWGTEQPKKGERYLMYFKKHKVGEYYYAIPSWMSAANYIAADASLSQYYNNYIKNNFSSNMVIKFPTEPDEDKKKELYDNLMSSFGGSHNAGNILLLFGENGVIPEISPVESVNADLYNSVADTIKLAIVSANRLTSPILAGIATSSGFSSKSDEIIAATVQYRLTVINSDRQFILNEFNNFLSMNGDDRVLTINDYNLTEEFEGQIDENNEKVNEGIGATGFDESVEEDEEAKINVEKRQME